MRKFLSLTLILWTSFNSFCQNIPNLSNSSALTPNTEEASKFNSVPVNLFTGLPQIGIPLYSYQNRNNGLSLDISLDYFAGGSQVDESPSMLGIGWNLNAGGIITRTVRGEPDDIPTTGYTHAAAIPTDYRSNGDGYFIDSLDAEQDVFQYSFNGRSGKFIIGKNGQIVQMPLTKLNIVPTYGSRILNQKLISFRIITEDGAKYDFSTPEFTTITSLTFHSWYFNYLYFSSWALTQIIAPFNTDTIKFNYTSTYPSFNFLFPQLTFVRNSDGTRTKTISPSGSNASTINRISSIVFPDKTNVSFVYSYGYFYAGGDSALSRIKIGDTTFRYGYVLDYQVADTSTHNPCRLLLKSVTPYTSKQKNSSYTFTYNTPLFSPLVSLTDTFLNKTDHWGFYNGAANGSNVIPSVNGYTWGANRSPNFTYAIANSLSNFNLPSGGSIFYEYELNDHLPFTKDPHSFTVLPTTSTSTNITLNQVFNTSHQITFFLDSSISRQGTVPITGTGSMIINIKNTAGTVTYKSDTLSLYDLFYHGIKTWAFTIPNGTYKFEQLAAAGTTITGGFTIYVKYENKLTDNTHTYVQAGGLRVKRITRKYGISGPAATINEYQYTNADGTSSGFMGDIPKYDYPYYETVNFGGTTNTSYTVVSSEPINTLSYAQGSSVGYSRVTVIDGTATHNIGKTVYDFTNLQDVNANCNTSFFPYAPQNLKDWGLGLPKTIATYDSIGTLVKKTVNTYGFDSIFFTNDNFKSLKLGNSFTIFNGDPNNASTPKVTTYLGQEYYPFSGRAYLVSSFDTLFQPNGSYNSSYKNYTYDTNNNLIKSVSSYDRTRGLQLENRYYYPYNYTISAGSIKKLKDSSILNTVISNENWITGDANPRIISGTITDYQQSGSYIKPSATYALQSNAPVLQSVIGTFNPATLNRSTSYFIKQTKFITYDSKGNLLQTQDSLSGINNSVIMDYNQQYQIAKVSNAAVNDIAYTSFEADGSGNWTIASALRDSLNSITGKKSYNLSNGNITKSGLTSSTTYLVTVWAKSGATVNVNGTALSTVLATQQGWNFYSTTITAVTTVTISGSGNIDELRLHPKDANMTTATYEPIIGLTSTTDANNTITYREYDGLNRLKIIRDKDKNILKRFDYSDSVWLISSSPAWSYTSKYCVDTSGHADSTFTDTNPFSTTYQSLNLVAYYDYCACVNPGSYPQYKIVSGKCEKGTQVITSQVYGQVGGVWEWTTTYHFTWSDGSRSINYICYSVNQNGCAMGP